MLGRVFTLNAQRAMTQVLGACVSSTTQRRSCGAREGAELSQVQIAERAGVSHATISRLETGQTWPGGRNVESVIDAYVTAIGLTQLEVLETIVENWRRDEYGGV